ncbi:hypothetical protein HYFRA_00003909 [Hymenoscyphus fraxineus]|uniref:Uncharacterized protein n=1 Tax=Hymenoscyphus fraxineus TaxID=746836 RepID=A0A9N9L2S8_9HELO|nr:hypothetical protein HYFRA_00003909 [Hymenoscyphus fraxineus]
MSTPNNQNTPSANQATTCFDGMNEMFAALLQEKARSGGGSTNTNRDDSIEADAVRLVNTIERDELKVLIDTETDKRKLVQYLREQMEIVSSIIRR